MWRRPSLVTHQRWFTISGLLVTHTTSASGSAHIALAFGSFNRLISRYESVEPLRALLLAAPPEDANDAQQDEPADGEDAEHQESRPGPHVEEVSDREERRPDRH